MKILFSFYKIVYFDNNRHRQTLNRSQNGTMLFNILDNTTEVWMTKYIIGEIFSSVGATLYKNPSDQTVIAAYPNSLFRNSGRNCVWADKGSKWLQE